MPLLHPWPGNTWLAANLSNSLAKTPIDTWLKSLGVIHSHQQFGEGQYLVGTTERDGRGSAPGSGSDDWHPGSYDYSQCECRQPSRDLDSGHHHDLLTQPTPTTTTQAQSLAILSSTFAPDDSGVVYFDSIHYFIQHQTFLPFSHRPIEIDASLMLVAVIHGLNPNSKLKWKAVPTFVPFGARTWNLSFEPRSIFETKRRLHSFHPYSEFATEVLYRIGLTPCSSSRTQPTPKILPAVT